MNTLEPTRVFDHGSNHAIGRKLKIGQRLTILALIALNFQLLDFIPIRIGPLSSTMILELSVFVYLFPLIRIYARSLDRRDKYILIVCLCMFVLSQINLTGKFGENVFKNVFKSMYVYFMIICFFSGRPEYGNWLRRLHLIPALAMVYAYFVNNVFSLNAGIDLSERIGGNDMPSYLMMLFPICIVQFKREHGLFKLLNLFVIGFGFLALIFSASRGGFIILLTVSVLIIFTQKIRGKKQLVIISMLALFALYVFLPQQNQFKVRVSTLNDPLSALNTERIPLWKAALLSIKENPLIGGNFRANVHRLVLEAAPDSNYARHILYAVAGGNFGVHNGYLAVLVHFGIIVGILYFIFFLSLGRAVLNTKRKIRDNANRAFLSACFISLCGYAVMNISFHSYIGMGFFVIWAMFQCSIKNALLEEKLKPYQVS